jgi:hypothetical protein
MTCHRFAVLRVDELERRDAPATLVNPFKVTYQDADGDDVSVTFSKPLLTAGNVNTVFTFNAGSVDGSNALPQQLWAIDLTGLGAAAAVTAVTVTATPSLAHGGDGFAAVGAIDATGIDLGTVTIDGDLGRILAGDGDTATTALKGLAVQSLGRYGTATGAPDLTTTLEGRLGFLTVKGDVRLASVAAMGGSDGTMGPVFIGGSLIGGDASFSGQIASGGDMGVVSIRGDLVGGRGVTAGGVTAGGKLTGVAVGGSVRGGGGFASGRILSGGDMGSVAIRGDLAGAGGNESGEVSSRANLAGVTIGGSVTGGSGDDSGCVASTASLGFVAVRGDLTGGGGIESGEVLSGARLAGITIGGSVRGAGDPLSGGSGVVWSYGSAGFINIRGDLSGAGGVTSGVVTVFGSVGSVSVGGSVRGGSAAESGMISCDRDAGTITIGGDVVGGTGFFDSGFIRAGRIAHLTIGGSLFAGAGDTTGQLVNNGAINAFNDLGTVFIRGSLIGTPTNPAVISARGSAAPTGTTDMAIGRLTVLGRVEFAQILVGVNSIGDAVNADAQIGAVTVGGDWAASSLAVGAVAGPDGFFGNADDAKMSGSVVKDDPQVFSKIASVTIAGQVLGTTGGADHFGIVAERIGAGPVGGTMLRLHAGMNNDDLPIGITGDFAVHEI